MMRSVAVAALIPFLVFLPAEASSETDALRRVVSAVSPFSSGGYRLTPAVSTNILSPDLYVNAYSHYLSEKVAVTGAPSPSPHNRRRRKIRNWIIGFLLGSVAGVLTGLLLSILFRLVLNCVRGRYIRPAGAEIFSSTIKSLKDLALLSEDPDAAGLELIGRGGTGEVFLKELSTPAGPRLFAIKKIRHRSAEAGDQILSEIRTVGRIRHRNLLPLLAHIPRPDCHFLIYEYMKNGSLQSALYDSAAGRLDLSWPARLRIALGVATGLEHLHLHSKPRIIHRDLKPANVLLDDDMEARIADFGFAEEVPDAETHLTMSNVAGTAGYIAPEYYQTMRYTAKCDVYSFGVMLAVMVAGRFPTDDFFVELEEAGMVKWMRDRVEKDNAVACFDGKIAGRGDDDQMELVLKVACFCTADEPNERPSSKEVRLMLAQIGGGGHGGAR